MMNPLCAALAAAFAIIALLAAPSEALAWGPATHLELAWRVMQSTQALPSPVAALITSYPLDYYYGAIAADIIVGKKLAHYLNHCHRWTVGLEVQDAAANDPQKSFAWGYLSHLAADVVAHNYYVPYKVILGFAERGRNHPFWEMRFDTLAPDHVWEIPRKISADMHLEHDELLKKVLSRQMFSFKANKVFFNNVLLMGRFRKWQGIIRVALSNKNPVLDLNRAERYKALSQDAMTAVLNDREDAWCFRADPTGEQCLTAASAIAAELRKSLREGRLSRDDFVHVLERYRPHLEASIYGEPDAEELISAAEELLAT